MKAASNVTNPLPYLGIDQLTAAVGRLEMSFQGRTVAVGSGFQWEVDGRISLVTAWHNVTGANPLTGQPISRTAVRPDAIHAEFLTQRVQMVATYDRALYQSEQATWRIHPRFGSKVDVAVIDMPPGQTTSLCVPINKLPQANLRVSVGGGAFIIGFPRGLTLEGTPIWKSGTIASEPSIALAVNHVPTHFLIDAATREGLSGGPVVLRATGSYQEENGNFNVGPGNFDRFLGLYSGRAASADQMEAQLGIVWPAKLIDETVRFGVQDSFALYG